jgi:hypothetical protein
MAQNGSQQNGRECDNPSPRLHQIYSSMVFSSSIVKGLNVRHLALRFAVEIGTMEAAASLISTLFVFSRCYTRLKKIHNTGN